MRARPIHACNLDKVSKETLRWQERLPAAAEVKVNSP